MQVIFIAAEVYPFSKVGGLGDVVGALPPVLAHSGFEIVVITPAYRNLDKLKFGIQPCVANLQVTAGDAVLKFTVSRWLDPKNARYSVYFLENETLFGSRNVYCDDNGLVYPDNTLRFIALQKAALQLILNQNWQPNIVHCHDHHTALVPIYLKTVHAGQSNFASTRTVLTLHNIAYQGLTEMEAKPLFGLPDDLFAPLQPLEWYGKINPLKGGILFADEVTTVSPTHASEIMTDEQLSAGLREVLASRSQPVTGILNGVDYTYWNPENDPMLFKNYSRSTIGEKVVNKKALLRQLGWPAHHDTRPLFGMVSRLVELKGIPLLLAVLPKIAESGAAAIILGSGQAEYEVALAELQTRFPTQLRFVPGYNEPLAHQIMAAADFYLMPSRFEPCGLTQMYALRYGTIPIVHHTGGLADTVRDWDGRDGTGLTFAPYEVQALQGALERALVLYQTSAYKKMRLNAMECDFSWEKSAAKYREIYQRLCSA